MIKRRHSLKRLPGTVVDMLNPFTLLGVLAPFKEISN